MSRPLTIGQLAEVTGVRPKTIRYYEQVCIIPRESNEKIEPFGPLFPINTQYHSLKVVASTSCRK